MMSQRDVCVEKAGEGRPHLHTHKRKGSVKCPLKTKAAPKGAPAWKNMNKDKVNIHGTKAAKPRSRKASGQTELEALFAKRKLNTVNENGGNEEKRAAPQTAKKPAILQKNILSKPQRVCGNEEITSSEQESMEFSSKHGPDCDLDQPRTQALGIQGKLKKFETSNGVNPSSQPALKPKPLKPVCEPSPPPAPRKPTPFPRNKNISEGTSAVADQSTVVSDTAAGVVLSAPGVPSLVQNDSNHNKVYKPSKPAFKPKPLPKKEKPKLPLKPKSEGIATPSDKVQQSQNMCESSGTVGSVTEHVVPSFVPPAKPPRVLVQSAPISAGTEDQDGSSSDRRGETVSSIGNTERPELKSVDRSVKPKSWLYRVTNQGEDDFSDSGKASLSDLDSSEDLYQDVDENDEGWEDCDDNVDSQARNLANRLFVPRKSSVVLRHSADGSRSKRRHHVSKSRYASDPEQTSASGHHYDDVAVPSVADPEEDWETDGSADSDGYEIVDEELLKSLANSYPVKKLMESDSCERDTSTDSVDVTLDDEPPVVPQRSHSRGKGDINLQARVPPQPSRPPGPPPAVPSPLAERKVPPVPSDKTRRGAPPPLTVGRSVSREAALSPPSLPDKTAFKLKLDESALSSRPPPPLPLNEPPVNDGEDYTVIEPSLPALPPVSSAPAPPLPPRSPMFMVGSPVGSGPSSPLLHPDMVVPPPVRPTKTTPGKPLQSTKALSAASLASRVPLPPRAHQRSNSADPELQQDGYLRMNSNNPTPDVLSEVPESYIDPYKDPDFSPVGQPIAHSKSTPVPFENLWQNMKEPGATDDNYLVLLEGEELNDIAEDQNSRGTSSLFTDEPLYQIYHMGAVARDVIGQSGEVEESEEDDYYAIYEEAETVKSYVSTILSRGSFDGASCEVPEKKSTLEQVAKLGAGVRTLWSEMNQVKESGVLERLTGDERKLQESLFEIITSEASYLKSINLLVSHFMESKEFSLANDMFSVVSKRDHHVLFSNVLAVRRVSKSVLLELEELWLGDCVLSIPEICSVLTRYALADFSVYVKYTSNQVYQERILTELIKKNFLVRESLMRLQAAEACQGLTIQSFLTLPMQRITRLPLLVDAVCHRLDPTHPDYQTVVGCLNALQGLVKQCNEGARKMSNIEQITEIDRMLEFNKAKKIPLVKQSRYLVKKGHVTRVMKASGKLLDKLLDKKKETLWLFLFNDILLITKKKGNDHYEVKEHAPRINIHADFLGGEDLTKRFPSGVPGACKHVILMVLLEKNMEYVLACDSMSERTRWVEAVNPPQNNNEDEKIYEDWDCPQVQAIHQYVAKDSDELSLEESDVINVNRKMADGWYEGERIRDGQRGWFPSNHTVEIQSAHMRAKNLRQKYRLQRGGETS